MSSHTSKRPRKWMFYGLLVMAGAVLIGLYAYSGTYGINVVVRHGASIWHPISNDDPRTSKGMCLALRELVPAAVAGKLEWQSVANGFEVAELPVLAEGSMVDQILLARIDPALYRFQVHNVPAGNREPADWMKETGAVLVINGSYCTRYGTPETPLISQGIFLGPREYDARHGHSSLPPASSVSPISLSKTGTKLSRARRTQWCHILC